jgi:glycosyltransferase involved in cell wall biosynthesis
MPAFFKPLLALVAEGHEIDVVVADPTNGPPPRSPAERLGVRSLVCVPWRMDSPAGKARSAWALYSAISRRMPEAEFVYCHGAIGTLGSVVARRAGVPCGARLYGVHAIAGDLQARKEGRFSDRLLAAFRRPLQYFAFRIPKRFLLVTDDGSCGAMVQDRVGAPKFRFHCWMNGVDLEPAQPLEALDPDADPILFYPARIGRKKRQHLAIELLSKLPVEHRGRVRLKLAGHTNDEAYAAELGELAASLGVGAQVEFLGSIPKTEVARLSREAVAVLSVQRHSNLGNAALEALVRGSVVISVNDGSLDCVVRSGESGFLVEDMTEGAEVVGRLLESPELRLQIGQAASVSARSTLQSWEARVRREVEEVLSTSSETVEGSVPADPGAELR